MNKIFYLLFSFLLVTTLALLNIKTIPAQAQTQECTYSCPMYHFEWQTKQCPANYTHVSQQHPGYCYKGGNPDWPEDYKIMDTVNHSADVVYEKSNDPHKCHRPSDNTLRDIYGMDNSVRGIFKADHSE